MASNSNISKKSLLTLILSIGAVAASGMIYELVIATVSSYVLGDNVTQFSLVVGIFLCAMGAGAALSRKIYTDLIKNFLIIELWLGFLGIIAAPILLYVGFAFDSALLYFVVMLIFTASIGTFVGLEIPLISRYIEQFSGSRKALSNVLASDYIGSLLGAVVFPLLLLPISGLIGSAAIAGTINVVVAVIVVISFRNKIGKQKFILSSSIVLFISLIGVQFVNSSLFNILEEKGYRDKIIHKEQTPFQRVVITQGKKKNSSNKAYLPRRWKDDMRLFLDGHLQFSSLDEYRYHESLVHPAMSLNGKPQEILILGGGDGLAVFQILKYPAVKRITLVDIDAKIIELAKNNKYFAKLNNNALSDARVDIQVADAFNYIRHTKRTFDIIISDLPDPHSPTLSKLYSREFYALLKNKLNRGGIYVAQSSSPYFARRAYWSIGKSLSEAGFGLYSYHVNVPSFGEWGFQMGSLKKLDINNIKIAIKTKFITEELIKTMFVFGKDIDQVAVEANTLDNMKLYSYYQDSEWEE